MRGGSGRRQRQNVHVLGLESGAGGAVAAVRKNVFLRFRNSTFTGNFAVKGGGGAVILSGLQTGARFDDNCAFKNNSAAESGGALQLGDAASVHVQEAYAINNRAGKNGGFVSTSFASASLFEALMHLSIASTKGIPELIRVLKVSDIEAISDLRRRSPKRGIFKNKLSKNNLPDFLE